jgi:DNA-binding CsgD family transcriptional regulator
MGIRLPMAHCMAASTTSDLANVIEVLGSARLGSQLLTFLQKLCGAVHCAMFEFGGDVVRELGSASLDGTGAAHRQALLCSSQRYWRQDPAIPEEVQRNITHAGPVITRVAISTLTDGVLRDLIYPNVFERVTIYGPHPGGSHGLSILRKASHGFEEEVRRLVATAPLLLSLVSKHAEIMTAKQSATHALASLDDIARCIARSSELSRREGEVCARFLYGLSSIGIALDLGIGEESVKTYRKRAYLRLGIGSPRELLTWYLEQWGKHAR